MSVGSLYQYFPNKQALVAALVREHCEEMLAMLTRAAAENIDAPLPQAIRHYVRAMLAAHAIAPELHQVLVLHALELSIEVLREFEARCLSQVRSYLEHRKRDIAPTDLETAAFVLVTAVEAITHRAVLERPTSLASRALEDEICALVLRYLGCGEA